MEKFNPKSWILILALLLCCSTVLAAESPGIADQPKAAPKMDTVPVPAPTGGNEATAAHPNAAEDSAPDAAAFEDGDEPVGEEPDKSKGAVAEKGVEELTDPVAESQGTVQWKDDEQKSRCESHLARLKECFVRARYHSIQGDSCMTAEHARLFLEVLETCRMECPPGLVERNGYNKKIVRNLNWLYKLGKERCLK